MTMALPRLLTVAIPDTLSLDLDTTLAWLYRIASLGSAGTIRPIGACV